METQPPERGVSKIEVKTEVGGGDIMLKQRYITCRLSLWQAIETLIDRVIHSVNVQKTMPELRLDAEKLHRMIEEIPLGEGRNIVESLGNWPLREQLGAIEAETQRLSDDIGLFLDQCNAKLGRERPVSKIRDSDT